jgi:hypothetical protein
MHVYEISSNFIKLLYVNFHSVWKKKQRTLMNETKSLCYCFCCVKHFLDTKKLTWSLTHYILFQNEFFNYVFNLVFYLFTYSIRIYPCIFEGLQKILLLVREKLRNLIHEFPKNSLIKLVPEELIN